MGWIRIHWPADETAPEWVKELNAEANKMDQMTRDKGGRNSLERDHEDAIRDSEDWWNPQ